jgi:hypothetical protein
MMSADRWVTNTRNLTFVIPAKAGIHLQSAGDTKGWCGTQPLSQTKGREMDSRLRGNDEIGVRKAVSSATSTGVPH